MLRCNTVPRLARWGPHDNGEGEVEDAGEEPASSYFCRGSVPFCPLTYRMYYTTYRWGLIVLSAAFVVVSSVLISLVSLAAGIGFGVGMGIVMTVSLWFGFKLTEGAMAETGGVSSRPFLDIVDDRDPEVVKAYNLGILPRMPPPEPDASAEASPVENCPFCGALISRPEAVYCDECGKPVRSPGPTLPAPPTDSRALGR